MTTQINHRTIEAAMRQGRIERAVAFRQMAQAAWRGLHQSAKMVVAVFS